MLCRIGKISGVIHEAKNAPKGWEQRHNQANEARYLYFVHKKTEIGEWKWKSHLVAPYPLKSTCNYRELIYVNPH